MFKHLWKGKERDAQALDKAIEELAEARIQKSVAKRVTEDLERDRRYNHYADMVRRALWTPR